MNNLSNFQVPDIWEVKDVVNKLKNVMLNYTEMEAKVHDATNNEPWGASTTLMQEIAQGTFNYQYFNEIMPTIYRRFTEKEPKQWRQIYKALVLLEYLVKNGSERVIDDARSHVSLIKVLRNFYYIDEKGKDEGVNVRNRSKEIIELLSNTEKIRTERKLAKKNRNKYVGVGSDGMGSVGSRSMGGPMVGGAGPSRFVGFGSDSYSSGGGGISFNGDAYSFGQETPYPHQSSKYDIDDDDEEDGGYRSDDQSSSNKKSSEDVSSKKKDDDDDWGDFTCGETSTQQEAKPATNNNSLFDDDFADFQQAPEAEPPKSQPQQQPTQQKQQDLFDLLGDNSSSAPITSPVAQQQQQQPLHMFESNQPMTPTGYQHQQQQQQQQEPAAQPQSPKKEEDKAAVNLSSGMWAQASNFVSLDSLGKKAMQPTSSKSPSMNALKNNSVQADWNNWANKNSKPATPAATTQSSPFDDLLG